MVLHGTTRRIDLKRKQEELSLESEKGYPCTHISKLWVIIFLSAYKIFSIEMGWKMIIQWIAIIVLTLQCIGFALAKKKSDDTHSFLNYMVRFNVIAGTSSFYLMALIWIAYSISMGISTNPSLQMMIAASIFLAGIALPYKMYTHHIKRKDGETP